MQNLVKEINLISPDVKRRINQRLNQFFSFSKESDEKWFQELCFCILAANSKQKTAEIIEKSLNRQLLSIPQQELAQFIRNNKHRFHNNKAKYIVEARKHYPIKEKLSDDEIKNRNWLVKNIRGIGMKEASHFLRNTGSQNLAILDRHIINIMAENNLIEKPKSLSPKIYLEIEKTFNNLAKRMKMSSAELDLNLWYLKTGEVAK
ncbi:N-glycosylase/DNA lyase [Candidatus Pacearchaeota archaeon]|nr:N-glycosylase/DNA lyase [Candidatus Pacearchaeota archaeon]